MDDNRLWSFEESLWTEGPDNYREKVDAEVVMVLPRPPFVLQGTEAIDAVADTPVWDSAELSERTVPRRVAQMIEAPLEIIEQPRMLVLDIFH